MKNPVLKCALGLSLISLTSCSAMLGSLGKSLVHEHGVPLIERKISAAMDKHAPELKRLIDKNGDEIVQLAEAKGFDWTHPTSLGAIVSLLLGAFAGRKAMKADNSKEVERQRQEIDELYDKTIAKS